MTTYNTKFKPKFIHVIKNFLFNFNSLYKENKEFHGGLLCCLLENCVVKLNGSKYPHYDSSALEFSFFWLQMEIENSMNLLLETLASCHCAIQGEYLQKNNSTFYQYHN